MKYVNKSLERAITIIDLFDDRSVKLTATEIAQELGSSPGSLYPIIHTLIRHGYLYKDKNKEYSLGLKFLEKGNLILNTKELRLVARPHMEKLAEEYEGNAHLAVLRDGEVLYLDRVKGCGKVIQKDIIGHRAPAYGTALGKILLASLERKELDKFLENNELFSLTKNTITDQDALKEHLEDVRRNGFSIDNEEYVNGVISIATPIRDFNDDPLAAIGFSLHEPADVDRIKDGVVSSLRKKSLSITEELSQSSR